jgi:hypothetical protein
LPFWAAATVAGVIARRGGLTAGNIPSLRTPKVRNVKVLVAVAAAMIPLLAACGGSDQPTGPNVPQTNAPQQGAAQHGPMFP